MTISIIIVTRLAPRWIISAGLTHRSAIIIHVVTNTVVCSAPAHLSTVIIGIVAGAIIKSATSHTGLLRTHGASEAATHHRTATASTTMAMSLRYARDN